MIALSFSKGDSRENHYHWEIFTVQEVVEFQLVVGLETVKFSHPTKVLVILNFGHQF